MTAEIATGCNGPRVFVIADLHLGDERVAKARRFDSAKAMGAHFMARWNETVSEGDTVYVLGDAARRGHVKCLDAVNGKKHLICGNADYLAEALASNIFASIGVAKWMRGVILTHIPVHPSQLRPSMINIHGHLHGAAIDDIRYCCVSVEQTNYMPISIAELLCRHRQTTAHQEQFSGLAGLS